MLRLQDKYQIDSSLIELEILETIFIDALDAMIDVINALRAKGFKINVDDFGSGYSSLNQIANIPADIIKFDRVFANRSLKSNKGRQVIKSLIEMLKMVEYELVFEELRLKRNSIQLFLMVVMLYRDFILTDHFLLMNLLINIILAAGDY